GYFGPDPKSPIDSMGRLKDKKDALLAPVDALFDELKKSDSWWKLAFKHELGGRQLLVHNQHLTHFQASAAPGTPFQASATISSPFAAKQLITVRDFFGLMRETLSSLFDWLDRLETALKSHLQPRDTSWKPMNPGCPSFSL